MTYDILNAQLSGRNAQRRKLDNNTYAERRDDGKIAIRLHATDIISYSPDGTIVVSSGGWQTVTTKARHNSYTGGCYGHAHWSVIYLYRKSNSTELANDAASELAGMVAEDIACAQKASDLDDLTEAME